MQVIVIVCFDIILHFVGLTFHIVDCLSASSDFDLDIVVDLTFHILDLSFLVLTGRPFTESCTQTTLASHTHKSWKDWQQSANILFSSIGAH